MATVIVTDDETRARQWREWYRRDVKDPVILDGHRVLGIPDDPQLFIIKLSEDDAKAFYAPYHGKGGKRRWFDHLIRYDHTCLLNKYFSESLGRFSVCALHGLDHLEILVAGETFSFDLRK